MNWIQLKLRALFLFAFSFCVSVYIYSAQGETAIIDQLLFTALGDVTCSVTAADTATIGGEINIPAVAVINGKTYKVTTISSSAFEKCWRITKVTIEGDNLSAIGLRAFLYCNGIQDTIVLPNSMDENSTIGIFAFADINAPIKFLSSTPPTLQSSSGSYDTQFRNLKHKISIPCGARETYLEKECWSRWAGELNDPCFVSSFSDGVLCYTILDKQNLRVDSLSTKGSIDTLNIPETINFSGQEYHPMVIGESAFEKSQIHSIVLPNTIVEIRARAFNTVNNLSEIKLNEGLQIIRNASLANNSKLKTITIPTSVTLIEYNALINNKNIEKVELLPSSPPTISTSSFDGSTTYPFVVPCGTLHTYKTATNWTSFSSRIISACKPLEMLIDEALTKDTIVSSIAFSRTFPMNLWQELYLPFDVDSVLVLDEGEYFDINVPFDSTKNEGYFYLYGLKNIDMEAGSITFQEVHKLDGFTPYLILFIDKYTNYFEGKEVVFKTKLGEYTLTDNYSAPKLTSSYQLHGNASLWEHSLADGFTLSSSYEDEDGEYKFHFDYNENAPIHPFSWVVTPTKEIASKIMPAPRFLAGRWGNQSSGGEVTTSMQNTSNNSLTYTQSGSLLTLHTQGQPCKVYAVDGTLLLSTDAAQDEVTIELNKGLYIVYSNGTSHKILF